MSPLKSLVKTSALAVSLACALAPTTVRAQTAVFDYQSFVQMGKQYQQSLQQIQLFQEQLKAANNSLSLAQQQASPLSATQWNQYQSMFKAIVKVPEFINSTVTQQQQALATFTRIFPDWKQGTSYSAFATSLNNNTKGAAQELIDAANQNDSTFAQEKVNLDSLTQFHPKTQGEQLNVLILLMRQDIEQMQKMRQLTSRQSSSMGAYYGAIASQQKSSIQKSCEGAIQSALAIARNMNPAVQESDVRSYYLAQDPSCNTSG